MPEALFRNIVFKALIIYEKNNGSVYHYTLKERLDKEFEEREENFIFEVVAMIDSPQATLEKLRDFKPDFVIVDFSALVKISFNTLIKELIESPYRPKETIVINIEHNMVREVIKYQQNAYLAYIHKGPDMTSDLINVLGNLWVRRHQYA